MTVETQAPPRLFLIDTSAWVEVLRRGARGSPLWQRVYGLVAAQAAATTGMIRLEVLRGSRSPQHFQLSSRSLDALKQLSSDDLWDEAARLELQLRRLGVTAQSTDLLIAAVAIRAGATVLHRDRDFDAIARQTPLLVESHL